MTLVSDFLADEVRPILSDPDGDRWDDTGLIKLINKGLLNITIKTELYTNKKYLMLEDSVNKYDISNFAVKLLRVQYQTRKLQFKTHEELDINKFRWEADTGEEPTAIIINKQNRCNFIVYPIVTVETPGATETTPVGTAIGTADTAAIVVAPAVFTDTIPTEESKYLIIYYSRKLPKITAVGDELGIDEFVETPLAHFVAGFAFRSDMDTQNRQMAQEELGLYDTFLASITDAKSKNNTSTEYTSLYNPLG